MVKIATLRRPGAILSYLEVEGPKRPLVLVHGAGVDRRMYAPQVETLGAAGHHVIAVDLRGHGESTLDDGIRVTASDLLDDLVALLEHLDLPSAVLVGHSLGGNLAQELVRRHPQLVGGLVAIDCTWNTGPLSAVERFALRLAAPSLALIPLGAIALAVLAAFLAALPALNARPAEGLRTL